MCLFDDRFLEEIDGLLKALLSPLIEVVAALQVEVVRGKILGRLASRPGRSGLEQVRLEPLQDRLGNVFRGGREVAGRYVDRFGSHITAACINHLRSDPQRVSRAADAAGDENPGVEPGAQLPRDRRLRQAVRSRQPEDCGIGSVHG